MVTILSNAGTHHINEKSDNQDAIYFGDNSRFQVISLADGVSSCAEGKCGAQIASQAITNLFLKKADHFFEFETEQIVNLALSHILCELSQYATSCNKDVVDYSSTIASVVVDKRKKQMLCLNIGDSIIMAIGKGMCRILTAPDDSSLGCCVTTTVGAASMASVKLFNTTAVDSILICSDGAWRQMFERNNLKSEVANMLFQSDYDKLKAFLVRQNCFDDYSFISLDMRQKRRKSA